MMEIQSFFFLFFTPSLSLKLRILYIIYTLNSITISKVFAVLEINKFVTDDLEKRAVIELESDKYTKKIFTPALTIIGLQNSDLGKPSNKKSSEFLAIFPKSGGRGFRKGYFPDFSKAA